MRIRPRQAKRIGQQLGDFPIAVAVLGVIAESSPNRTLSENQRNIEVIWLLRSLNPAPDSRENRRNKLRQGVTAQLEPFPHGLQDFQGTQVSVISPSTRRFE
jgi:hypothetical protein